MRISLGTEPAPITCRFKDCGHAVVDLSHQIGQLTEAQNFATRKEASAQAAFLSQHSGQHPQEGVGFGRRPSQFHLNAAASVST